MSAEEPFRGGEPIEWLSADYTEDGVGSVTAGASGRFITIDGDSGDGSVVVSFDPVGAFCCRLADIRRIDSA